MVCSSNFQCEHHKTKINQRQCDGKKVTNHWNSSCYGYSINEQSVIIHTDYIHEDNIMLEYKMFKIIMFLCSKTSLEAAGYVWLELPLSQRQKDVLANWTLALIAWEAERWGTQTTWGDYLSNRLVGRVRVDVSSCVCVCVCMCVHVCMCACVHACACVHVCVYENVRVCVDMGYVISGEIER